MQTNNLYSCKATDGALHILTARDSEVATLTADFCALNTMRLRPVELRWIAYAAENFDALHQRALKAGAQQKHPLTILPDEQL
jgi:hypothetical protein